LWTAAIWVSLPIFGFGVGASLLRLLGGLFGCFGGRGHVRFEPSDFGLYDDPDVLFGQSLPTS
jgi:hypothetical protein